MNYIYLISAVILLRNRAITSLLAVYFQGGYSSLFEPRPLYHCFCMQLQSSSRSVHSGLHVAQACTHAVIVCRVNGQPARKWRELCPSSTGSIRLFPSHGCAMEGNYFRQFKVLQLSSFPIPPRDNQAGTCLSRNKQRLLIDET
jgi:hypothetical protein